MAIVPFLIHKLPDRLISCRESVKDSVGRGRKISASEEYLVEKVREMLECDGRYRCEELAQELDLSHGTVHLIIQSSWNAKCVGHRVDTSQAVNGMYYKGYIQKKGKGLVLSTKGN